MCLLVDDDGDDYLLTRLMLHDAGEKSSLIGPSYEAALEQLRSDSTMQGWSIMTWDRTGIG
jgi:hypothetical protein